MGSVAALRHIHAGAPFFLAFGFLAAPRYLNMAHLAEHKKEALRKVEQAEAA